MTDFPNGVNSPGAASYASPLLDFGALGQLEDSYQKGVDDRFKNQSRTAFRNGIPKTPDGRNDYKAMTDKMIELGDYGTASTIGNLSFQQSALDQTGTNPESPYYRPPASGAAPQKPTAAAPRDERPARADNNGGFNPPAQTADASAPASAPASTPPRQLAPNVVSEIDRRLLNGDIETRARNFGAMMGNPYLKDYAKARLEALLKAGELTNDEKNRISGTTQYNTNVKVEGDNRTDTPEMKNVRPGSGPGGKSAAQTAEDIKVEGANRTLTPGAKDTAPGPGGKSVAQTAEDIKVEGANRTITPEEKNVKPLPGESPAQAAERIKTKGAIAVDAGKLSVKNFDTEHVGLQKLAQSSFNGIEKAKLAKSLTMQPGFYSGPLQKTTEMYQQFKSVFGKDPTSALPQEAFQKVTTDMLTEQIKALGQSGVGRVLLAEVQNMQKGLASLGITAAGNRAQLEIASRVYQEMQDIGAISRQIAADASIAPEAKAIALDNAAVKYFKEHPLFTSQEKDDPRILSAPDLPSGVTTPAAVKAWANAVGLRSGDLAKFGGKIGTIP